MNRKSSIIIFMVSLFAIAAIFFILQTQGMKEEGFISYIVDPRKQDLKFFWQNDKRETFKSIQNLKTWLEEKDQQLIFAMNGGMYNQSNSPKGLFIENGKVIVPVDTSDGTGNFYLKPNGVFFITTGDTGVICSTAEFKVTDKIKYATQSGPMLVTDGKIHDAFKENSVNSNIRNGVGILPNNKIVFAMSKQAVNFYDFATYFKRLGCKNALYLDGLVSRTYLPEQDWIQVDGNFGVIIAVLKRRI